MTKNRLIFFTISIILLFSVALIHFLTVKPIISYTVIFILSSVIYLIVSWRVFKTDLSSINIYIIIFAALLLRLSFINATPIGSDDVYRYMWDGKIQANGINPYLYTPDDAHLSGYHSDLLPAALNFKKMKTIYFPLSQWLFYTGYMLSGESVWGYKLLLFIFELLTVAGLYLLLKKFKIDRKYLLLYALCPLPIFQFAIDAHLDGFGLPLLIFSIFFYFDRKKVLSFILLGLSLSVKPVGLLLIPIYFLNEKGILERAKSLIIPFIAFFAQFVFYIFSSNPFEALFIFTKNWYFNGFIFNILDAVINNNQTSRLICGILLFLSLIPVYFSKKLITDKLFFALMLLMIFSPVVHPWYITWLAVLLPFTKKGSGIYLAAACSLTAVTILNYQTFGIWRDNWYVQMIEYLPVFVLFFFEITGGKLDDKFITAIQE